MLSILHNQHGNMHDALGQKIFKLFTIIIVIFVQFEYNQALISIALYPNQLFIVLSVYMQKSRSKITITYVFPLSSISKPLNCLRCIIDCEYTYEGWKMSQSIIPSLPPAFPFSVMHIASSRQCVKIFYMIQKKREEIVLRQLNI